MAKDLAMNAMEVLTRCIDSESWKGNFPKNYTIHFNGKLHPVTHCVELEIKDNDGVSPSLNAFVNYKNWKITFPKSSKVNL